MPLHQYGVLKGFAVDKRIGAGTSPHYQVRVVDNTTDYRIAINVKSKLSPSELLYLVVDDFRHPILDVLTGLEIGFTELESQPDSAAMDYIRGNLFDRTLMRALPHAVPGPDNDLNEKIGAYVERAIADERAVVYALGERWGPEPSTKDKHFGFLPGNGVHDIHMNQGNVERFERDNGVWQDGGLLIHYPAIVTDEGVEAWPEQWVALFLAFQSQAWHTDDVTGHRIDDGPDPGGGPTDPPGDPTDPSAGEPDGNLRIVAALVNPEGHDPGLESVTLLNTTPGAVDLEGWAIADKNKKRSTLSGVVEAGAARRIILDGAGAQLSNRGGIITLLDKSGLKVDGVSYTRQEARKERWTLVF